VKSARIGVSLAKKEARQGTIHEIDPRLDNELTWMAVVVTATQLRRVERVAVLLLLLLLLLLLCCVMGRGEERC
jgi:hypothetical protein